VRQHLLEHGLQYAGQVQLRVRVLPHHVIHLLQLACKSASLSAFTELQNGSMAASRLPRAHVRGFSIRNWDARGGGLHGEVFAARADAAPLLPFLSTDERDESRPRREVLR
jgi:hypothetical protein